MNKKFTGVEQILAQGRIKQVVSGIFSTIGRMFIEKTPWKVRKIQNTEFIFQVPVPRVVKILIIYSINTCHMYKTYGGLI